MKKDKNFFHGHSRLAEEREKLWATQQEAADFFGVSRVTWGQCERGNATPSGDVLAGLAQQGADVLYVLTGQRNRPAAKELPTDEQMLLDAYRELDASAKKKLLASALGAGPMGNHQVSSGAGAIQIGGASRVKVNKGR